MVFACEHVTPPLRARVPGPGPPSGTGAHEIVEKTMKAGSYSVHWMNRPGTAVAVLGVKLLLSQMHKLSLREVSDMSKFSQEVSC